MSVFHQTKRYIILLFLFLPRFAFPSTEYDLYLKAGSRCQGKNVSQALKTGFQLYNQWKVAIDNYKTPKKNLFRDAAMAFDYVVKSGCKDGLVLYRLGNLHRHKKRCAQAIFLINKSLPDLNKYYPKHRADAYHTLGLCYTQQGQHDQAISSYKEAIRINPGDIGSHINLANRFYWKKQYQKALDQLEITYKKIPGVKVSEWGRGAREHLKGWVHIEQKKLTLALNDFHKAYQERKHIFDIEGIAWVYQKQNKKKEAHKYWQIIEKHFQSGKKPHLTDFRPETIARFSKNK